MPRSIVHLDADAFFASVEQAGDPKLRGKPIAVGGEKRGIIASACSSAGGTITAIPWSGEAKNRMTGAAASIPVILHPAYKGNTEPLLKADSDERDYSGNR